VLKREGGYAPTPKSMVRTRITGKAIAVAAAISATVVAATALADATVYDNDFSSRAEFSEIFKSGGGKQCDRRYRARGKSMVVSVRDGKVTCSFRPPVMGDEELPNHNVTVGAKVLKKTPKSVRGGAFLELDVRAGGGGVGYSFRVFPQKRRFEVRRGPAGAGFPASGTSDSIKKINQRNQLRLVAAGARVQAFVNGSQVANVADSDPGQVSGRKIRFAVGNAKQKSKDVVATVKQVAVAVPER
jgi:hypothetical protein